MSNAPVFDVAVCAAGSVFVHVTLSPTLIVVVAGANAKLAIVTFLVA